MAGMPRSGGSLHLQPGLMGIRGQGPVVDSPSSLSLNGALTPLDAGQGSLTSNALFGSLNLEELLSTREMEQQGRELLASMRAADAHQRFGRPGDAPQQQQHQQPQHAAAPAPAVPMPDFAGFPRADTNCSSQPAGKTSDDIWRGLGMDLQTCSGWSAPHSSLHGHVSPSRGGGGNEQPARNPSLAPDLGGYLSAAGSLRAGSSPGHPLQQNSQQPPPQHGQQHSGQLSHAAQAQQRQQHSGLGAGTHSLTSSISGVSSTGLTHGLNHLGMYSSGSTEVASHLVAAGGSGWYSQLGLHPPTHGSGEAPLASFAAARAAAGYPLPGAHGSMASGAAMAAAAAAGAQLASGGALPPGGSTLGSYGSAGNAASGGSHPGTPNLGGLGREAGLRRASVGGAYPGLAGSPRFSSHAPLPMAGALFGTPMDLPANGGGASPPRFPGAGRDGSLSPGVGSFGMLPPPNLVMHAGGLPRGGGRGGSVGTASPEPSGIPSAGGRSRSRGAPQPALPTGRGGRSGPMAAFPDIPAAGVVPRVRAAPADADFDVCSEAGRTRVKGGKGRHLSEREKEQRDLKRKEANRESAARSRDKRLKLIADLEVEVEQLKRQHAEFKTKMIESTVPRPAVTAALEDRKRALRRVRTDPADTEAHIRSALLCEGLDLKALAAQVRMQVPAVPKPVEGETKAAESVAPAKDVAPAALEAAAAGDAAPAAAEEEAEVLTAAVPPASS